MLVLSRKENERIRLGDSIVLTVVRIRDDGMEGTYVHPRHGKRSFVTRQVPSDIAVLLDRTHTRYERVAPSRLWSMLVSWVLPVVPFLLLFLFLSRRMAQNGPGAGLLSLLPCGP